MKNDSKSSNSNKVNLDDFFIIDAELLPLVEKAEEGCLSSQQRLFEVFVDGDKAKVNYEIAVYYLDLAYKTINHLNLPENEFNNKIRQNILWNKAQTLGLKGDVEATKEAFFEMIDFMRDNLPLEDWNFSQLETIINLIHQEGDF